MKEDDLNKLSRLCRISVTEEEKKDFLKSLDNVISYIAQLDDVDTEGVEPCFTVHEALKTVMRDDVPEAPLSRDLFLANAPSHVGGMIRVPPVFKQ